MSPAESPLVTIFVTNMFMILGAAAVVVFLLRQYRIVRRFGTPWGLLLMAVAFFAIVMKNLIEVGVILIFPLIGRHDQALAILNNMDIPAGEPLLLIGAGMLVVGFVTGLGRLVLVIQSLNRARAELDVELNERCQLERDLSTALTKAETANVAKSEFLSTMSHEVRTPLNTVLGYVDLLLSRDFDPDTQGMHKLIKRSGQSLLSLLNQILDLSTVEAGKLELEVHEFDLPTFIDAIETFWSKQFDDPIKFDIKVQPDLETCLTGDEMRLRQIIDNLLCNAKKFTESGSVALSFSGAWEGDLYALRIVVKDTGIGLAPDAQAKIFEPFVQADQSISRKYEGTGLGLSLCQHLAQEMAGDIFVESTAGHGSVFTLTLRLPGPQELGQVAAGL